MAILLRVRVLAFVWEAKTLKKTLLARQDRLPPVTGPERTAYLRYQPVPCASMGLRTPRRVPVYNQCGDNPTQVQEGTIMTFLDMLIRTIRLWILVLFGGPFVRE